MEILALNIYIKKEEGKLTGGSQSKASPGKKVSEVPSQPDQESKKRNQFLYQSEIS
jgi:hypothetical protein